MNRTGILSMASGNSTLDDGSLLARCDESDPLGAATNFLQNRGFQDGDRIQVTGTDGTIGSTAVFCMTGVQAAVAAALPARVLPVAAKPIRPAGITMRGGSTRPSAAHKKATKKRGSAKKGGTKSSKGKGGKRS
jgi:hypothetical protein